MADKSFDPTLIGQDFLEGLGAAQIAQLDHHAGIQERQFTKAVLQGLQIEIDVGKGGQGRHEGDMGAGQVFAVLAPGRLAGDDQGRDRVAAFEAHFVRLSDPIDLQQQIVGQGVDHRNAHPVQTAGNLVRILVELPAGMELGHDDLGRADALFVHVSRNAAPIVGDGHRAIGVQGDLDQRGVAGQGLVDGVIDHLIDHVVQARAVVGVADIHARPLAHRIEALEHLDGVGAVVVPVQLAFGGGGVTIAVGDFGIWGLIAHVSSVASLPASTPTP
jgi:hypothetical protein